MTPTDPTSVGLDLLVPPFDEEPGDWNDVLRRADVAHQPAEARPCRRSGRRSWTIRAATAAAIAAIAALALLLLPIGDRDGGILDRALAAVGNGPVLHLVLREDWGGTIVQLATGDQQPFYGDREVWYSTSDGLHTISKLDGTVLTDAYYQPSEVDASDAELFRLLGTELRTALQTGTARNLGGGEAYGLSVYWIRVDDERLPDVGDGKFHEWARDVAVSRDTYEPVAVRETRDGTPIPGAGARIISFEMLAADQGDFTARRATDLDATVTRTDRDRLAMSGAESVLGRPPLWLGSGHANLALTAIERVSIEVGTREKTLLTGGPATDARACRAELRGTGATTSDACRRMRDRGPVEIRGDRVYALGRVTWTARQIGVSFSYGSAAARTGDPYVTITQFSSPPLALAALGQAFPPEGTAAVTGHSAALVKNGLYVLVDAASESLALSAARALKAIGRG